jgi:adenylate kinase
VNQADEPSAGPASAIVALSMRLILSLALVALSLLPAIAFHVAPLAPRERHTAAASRLSPVLALAGGASSPKIIICGAPASGKGTQCELLKDKYGVVHISTGDVLREAVSAGSPVGVQAKGFMERGELVPDEVIIGIVKDRLVEDDCQQQGWLLDGFPRTEAQAVALSAAGITPQHVLFLEVPDELLIERVVGRRSDPVTGKIYHVKYAPPETEEIAGRLTQRADDTEEKCRVRLEAFHTHMAAVEKCYADLITYTDGTQPKEAVFAELQKCLEK